MTAQQINALEKAKMYKALTGTPIDDDIIEAFESALTELSAIKQTLADCITLLTQSGSNTKEQVLEKLRGLIE